MPMLGEQKSGGSPRGKGLPPFPSYKENTYSAEVQIALTLRNSSSIVKMRRFAADGGWRVLSYEAGMEGWHPSGRRGMQRSEYP